MRYQKVDERDATTEEGVTHFRVAYIDPYNYVDMYDVDCDDVEKVIAWAESFVDNAGPKQDSKYYIAVRSSHREDSPGSKQEVSLIWLTPYPEGL